MNVRLIDEWRMLHKMASVRVAALFATLLGLGPALISVWGNMPDDLKQALPQGTARYVSIAGFALCVLARAFRFGGGDDGNH